MTERLERGEHTARTPAGTQGGGAGAGTEEAKYSRISHLPGKGGK